MSGRYRSFQWSMKTMSNVSTSYFFFSWGMMSWDAPMITVTWNSAPLVPAPMRVKEITLPGHPTVSLGFWGDKSHPLCLLPLGATSGIFCSVEWGSETALTELLGDL